jgi:hypothetical protein
MYEKSSTRLDRYGFGRVIPADAHEISSRRLAPLPRVTRARAGCVFGTLC